MKRDTLMKVSRALELAAFKATEDYPIPITTEIITGEEFQTVTTKFHCTLEEND